MSIFILVEFATIYYTIALIKSFTCDYLINLKFKYNKKI